MTNIWYNLAVERIPLPLFCTCWTRAFPKRKSSFGTRKSTLAIRLFRLGNHPDYCRKFAEAFGVKIFFQWKEGGFKREMLRKEEYTAPTHFECIDHSIGKVGGTSGKLSTRWKFPQASPDLKVRWCSSYLKIDVCTSVIVNQERFRGIRTLVISGERERSPHDGRSILCLNRIARTAGMESSSNAM